VNPSVSNATQMPPGGPQQDAPPSAEQSSGMALRDGAEFQFLMEIPGLDTAPMAFGSTDPGLLMSAALTTAGNSATADGQLISAPGQTQNTASRMKGNSLREEAQLRGEMADLGARILQRLAPSDGPTDLSFLLPLSPEQSISVTARQDQNYHWFLQLTPDDSTLHQQLTGTEQALGEALQAALGTRVSLTISDVNNPGFTETAK